MIPKNGAALSIELVIAFAAGIGAAVGFIEGRKSREQDKADGIERDQYYKISTLISWPIIWGGRVRDTPPFFSPWHFGTRSPSDGRRALRCETQ